MKTSDLDLLLRPLIQVDRLDLGDVNPQVSMDASTADTDEDAQIPGCPSWTWKSNGGGGGFRGESLCRGAMQGGGDKSS